uniref:Vacuolar protein sorting-associated protein 13 VPS13 adaptor binding domain-containing protein n=1 Tax=Corethron hystrix TaxID=216773 RepID=A0A7S1BUD7_9STRA
MSTALSLHCDVDAPKLWIPVSARRTDGALFVDAGRFKMVYTQKRTETDCTIRIDAADMQLKYVACEKNARHAPKADITVVQPFNINLTARLVGESVEKWKEASRVDVKVGKIMLNLIDVEAVATAISRFYAHGVARMSRRGDVRPGDQRHSQKRLRKARQRAKKMGRKLEAQQLRAAVVLDKIGMQLEGFAGNTDREEQDSRRRTYDLSVSRIRIDHSHRGELIQSSFAVDNISVVQIHTMGGIQKSMERQWIFVRKTEPFMFHLIAPGEDDVSAPSSAKNHAPSAISQILEATYFHDGIKHLTEIEVDVGASVTSITPTSLRDILLGCNRIAEIVQLMTKEIERKVHQEGRLARDQKEKERDRKEKELADLHRTHDRPEQEHADLPRRDHDLADSSVLFKVTMRNFTVVAGHPLTRTQMTKALHNSQSEPGTDVVQCISNVLVMFQSVENPDTSGNKTLHVSVDDLSSSLHPTFWPVVDDDSRRHLLPVAMEFRAQYHTENSGHVTAQKFSFHSEKVHLCIFPPDLRIIQSIADSMSREYGAKVAAPGERSHFSNALFSFRKSGSGVATSIWLELQTFKCVLMRETPASPLFDLNATQVKCKLEGAMSALSGECSAISSLNFYNLEIHDWEPAIEPWRIVMCVQQLPNDLSLSLATPDVIQTNITSVFLRDIVEMNFNRPILHGKKRKLLAIYPPESQNGTKTATGSITLFNNSGFDVVVRAMGSAAAPTTSKTTKHGSDKGSKHSTLFQIPTNDKAILESCFRGHDQQLNDLTNANTLSFLSLELTEEAKAHVGPRETLFHLPYATPSQMVTAYPLLPSYSNALESCGSWDSRATRETRVAPSRYDFEAVVEECVENCRLRESIVDVYSLNRGNDLLCSSIWCPISRTDATKIVEKNTFEDDKSKTALDASAAGNLWVKPYGKNDAPPWSDMTCVLPKKREGATLPDNSWLWLDDWTVDVGGVLGDTTDDDGWEYESDFDCFSRNRRAYRRGDNVRRRRWTRTRMLMPPKLDDPRRKLLMVWETTQDKEGNFEIHVRSMLTIHNNTDVDLILFLFCPSWESDIWLGRINPHHLKHVPISLASATHIRLATPKTNLKRKASTTIADHNVTSRVLIVPTSYTSSYLVRTCLTETTKELHFINRVECKEGVVSLHIDPVVKFIGLLPCFLKCQFGETMRGNTKKVLKRGEVSIEEAAKTYNVSVVNPAAQPHVSIAVPGYHWSPWCRIVNRKPGSESFLSSTEDEKTTDAWENDTDHVREFKSIVHFDRVGGGDPLALILSVEVGHCPILRVYAQYWVMDKTGFGLRFAESSGGLLEASTEHTSRRSYLPTHEAKKKALQNDILLPGHEWSIGMCGMTFFFSEKSKFSVCVEAIGDGFPGDAVTGWMQPLDVSNVCPNTVFSLEEDSRGMKRKFEFALSVSLCPSIYSRTKTITIIPRYNIVNLLENNLLVSQDGTNLDTFVPSQRSILFHWDDLSLPPKIRLSVAAAKTFTTGGKRSNGTIQLDKIGITAMRVPIIDPSLKDGELGSIVVQAEVRLAAIPQTCAVVVVIWASKENSSPLYLLRNLSKDQTITCRQVLREVFDDKSSFESTSLDAKIDIVDPATLVVCSSPTSGGPKADVDDTSYTTSGSMKSTPQTGDSNLVTQSFDLSPTTSHYEWILPPNGSELVFGFDEPEKEHKIEWSFKNADNPSNPFEFSTKNSILEVDAMGSWNEAVVCAGHSVRGQIKAEHSTKVIEFFDVFDDIFGEDKAVPKSEPCDPLGVSDEEEAVAFKLRMDLPGITVSIIDNAPDSVAGREILFLQLDSWMIEFSQTRDGRHELEVRLMSLQLDNHVHKATHPVLLFCPRLDESEPFLHMSAIRRLQPHYNTYVFRYAALRVLNMEILLDRRTAETIARFIRPLRVARDVMNEAVHEPQKWINSLTSRMSRKYGKHNRKALRDVEKLADTANSGRIYFEELHLHPLRLSFTFSQEWMEWNAATEGLMIFQFIRGMASIHKAPLTFTSFVVSHAFEAPQVLSRIIIAHFSSQLTKQFFGILGSLAILEAPADILGNVGNGVRDFFYEPINGMILGPSSFLEGLEIGTQSLARGFFFGICSRCC